MTLRFEQILADGVAQCSYLVGDDSAGTAAVIDPRPDVDIYLEIARRHGLTITHVFETHIHADFMSGARELVDRLGGSAKLWLSVEGGAEYGFGHEAVHDGDCFDFGKVELEVKATPGHTPEHVAFFIREQGKGRPWGVITGDSLFVNSVGRPDLLGEEETEDLVRALFRTLREVYLPLDDEIIIYPGHAAGSACGPDIGDRMSSTIGYERRNSPYFAIDSLDEFNKALERDAPPVPAHYPRMKKLNAEGPPILGNLPKVPALTAQAFAEAVPNGRAQILDTRDMLAFGGGFVEGAINIGARPELSVWAGALLDPGRPIHLVLDDDRRLAEVVTLLWRVGLTNFAGYLAGGMRSWQEAGRDLHSIPQITVHELNRKKGRELLPLDVRKPDEWAGGHVPGARHIFLGDLGTRLDELDRNRPVATYCGSGFRSSIAASILAANGFNRVHNVPGSWKAWKAAGFEIARADDAKAA